MKKEKNEIDNSQKESAKIKEKINESKSEVKKKKISSRWIEWTQTKKLYS